MDTPPQVVLGHDWLTTARLIAAAMLSEAMGHDIDPDRLDPKQAIDIVNASRNVSRLLRDHRIDDDAVVDRCIGADHPRGARRIVEHGAQALEELLLNEVADCGAVRHVVLICSAVNFIDTSALETLENLIEELREAGVTLHLAEVKGPVMDRLKRSHFLDALNGRVFLSQYDAWMALADAPGATPTPAAMHAARSD